MRKLPPLTAIRAFEAAARNENFTAAAGELGMTQAAVSYQVKALEERLGAALFVREKGRARLTPLGGRLLPALSQAFDAMEAAFEAHRADDESLLTITTTSTFANAWLAWRLGAFQMRHPDLAVRMTTGNEVVDLRSGDTDVAIRGGIGKWHDVEKHLLVHSTFTPMASPRFIAETERRLGRGIERSDLLDLNLITPEDEWWTKWFDDAGLTLEGAPKRRGVRLDNQANEGHAAMAGMGVALLTPFFWANDIDEGRLVLLFPEAVSSIGWSYWLVFPHERRNVPKIKRFREWLSAEIPDEARSSAEAVAARASG
ncbi:LysR family transcriptional regulator [Sphingomonas sabuli]|uniref:LysR family transcriptional regulator n=1 Tax=Sphingomonas sabuli TaxID=2764186 RepID=A0A7G9L2E3_9SPHN|nr:LysR substrate-binding domain-containing protein [Sphingomonas sabuli]QNM82792.1 LysR family transcriptional regulator [Sphingomonas sabuli]